tara:strand:+ start:958 stop:1230 length:273 start_codon:yes stop_codon:yes gene_type:complete
MAKIELVTKEELREELNLQFSKLSEILLNNNYKNNWVKSDVVKEVLGISMSTLQTYRNNGTIPYSKIGGVILYNIDDINNILSKNKISNK